MSATKYLKLQDLPPIDKTKTYIRSLLSQSSPKKSVYSVKSFVPQTGNFVSTSTESFIAAALEAYNNHAVLVLNPDDIWSLIMLRFTQSANNNMKHYKKFIVGEESDIKELTVTEVCAPDQVDDWSNFFVLMNNLIKQNCVTSPDGNTIVDLLEPSFTTTTQVNKIIAGAVVMDTTKKLFKFGRVTTLCGITGVQYEGTLEDWNDIITKMAGLSLIGDNDFQLYIDNLIPVLTKLIEGFNGVVDLEFWNNIIKFGGGGSGHPYYITGWLKNFYTTSNEYELTSSYSIDVPVKWVNKCVTPPVTTQMKVSGKFDHVHVDQMIDPNGATFNTYRPVITVYVSKAE